MFDVDLKGDDGGDGGDGDDGEKRRIVTSFSRSKVSRQLNMYTNLALVASVVLITLSRCLIDPDICSSARAHSGESTTLSFIIDKSWVAMFAMSAFTVGCCVHIFMAWYVYFPLEPFEWTASSYLSIVTLIRVLHTIVFFHGFLIGIFRVGEAPRVHYGVAVVLFAAAGVETTLILYRAVRAGTTNLLPQLLLWIMMTTSLCLYLALKIGWFELAALGLLPCFYLFLNYDMGSDNAEVECILKFPEISAVWRLHLPRSLYRIK